MGLFREDWTDKNYIYRKKVNLKLWDTSNGTEQDPALNENKCNNGNVKTKVFILKCHSETINECLLVLLSVICEIKEENQTVFF